MKRKEEDEMRNRGVGSKRKFFSFWIIFGPPIVIGYLHLSLGMTKISLTYKKILIIFVVVFLRLSVSR